MNYKRFFLWIVLVSYIISWVDLSISWFHSSVFKVVSNLKDKEAFHLISQYQLYWIYCYYASIFFLYLSIVMTVPIITKQKHDFLFSFSMLFFIHLSEDIFYWFNAFIIGFYQFGDPVWNPNFLLPVQLQWLNITLFKIYIIDLLSIIFFISLWYFYSNNNRKINLISESRLTSEIIRKLNEIGVKMIRENQETQKLQRFE